MRRYAMEKIIRMPLGFFDGNTSGRIRKIIDENATITHSFLAHQLPDLAATIVMPLTALVLVFVFDWRLGLACLIPIVLSLLLMGAMTGERGRHLMKTYMNSLEEMNTEATEYVRGIPVVKVFQQTVFSFKSFHKSIMNYKELVVEFTRMWEKPMSAYVVVINSFVLPVVLLDEATASLDVENETRIQAGISELVRDKTVLIIAHRMRTVATADKIVVLVDGRVVETGRPEELQRQKGIFSKMVDRQMQRGFGMAGSK